MTQRQPLISIIVPNFNCLPYLNSCLNSIDRQTQSRTEIIFIDDGSTDGSREFLMELTRSRDDVRLILENGVGPGAARNIGVQIAEGDYLAFLDADDQWTDNKLARQVAFMVENQDVTLSFTNYEHISDADHKAIIPCFDFWPEFKHQVLQAGTTTNYRILPSATGALFKENVVGTSSVMCRKDAFIAVGGFDTNLPSASDWDLWLKLSKVGDVAFTAEVQMNYLVRAGSVSRNQQTRIQAMETIAQRHVEDAKLQCSNAQRFVKERLLDAYCELFSTENRYWPRLLKHLETLVSFPSKRRFKSTLKAALRF